MDALLPFTHEPHPARVVFGEGRAERLAEEVARFGCARPMIFASARLAGRVAALLSGCAVATATCTVAQVLVMQAKSARETARASGADVLVAAGGGSPIGLAKAVALETGLPIVALPTTYSGSEMTSVWGVVEDGVKRTGRDARVRPRTVVYDPLWTREMPAHLAATSGLNALAHAVEASYARGADPLTVLFAEEAVRALAEHLPAVVDTRGESPAARAGALYGSWLAGVCLEGASMGIHHKLCHVLGGSFGLPHAGTHAVLLPHATAFNRPAAPRAMERLARALSSADAPAGLHALARRLGAPTSLASLGMRREDLGRAADLAMRDRYDNPRPVDRAAVLALLEDAFEGRAPADPSAPGGSLASSAPAE
jgi:alcohol dehydrogenase class IV